MVRWICPIFIGSPYTSIFLIFCSYFCLYLCFDVYLCVQLWSCVDVVWVHQWSVEMLSGFINGLCWCCLGSSMVCVDVVWVHRWSVLMLSGYSYDRVEMLSGFINGLFLIVIAFFVFAAALVRLLDPPTIKTERLLVNSHSQHTHRPTHRHSRSVVVVCHDWHDVDNEWCLLHQQSVDDHERRGPFISSQLMTMIDVVHWWHLQTSKKALEFQRCLSSSTAYSKQNETQCWIWNSLHVCTVVKTEWNTMLDME